MTHAVGGNDITPNGGNYNKTKGLKQEKETTYTIRDSRISEVEDFGLLSLLGVRRGLKTTQNGFKTA